jgi:pyruvate/2-oxoacid:ferredoxin oxidoreductase beta subunit
MENGLLCHQATLAVTPLLDAEAAAPGAPGALQFLAAAGKDLLEKPSVWIVGGDGWAYDIGEWCGC